jgi:predicted alpha/beta superfamily hydrolase
VLYQHDGQNIFTDRDAELPFGSWGVDDWVTRLYAAGLIGPVLVVGIDNSPARRREYSPWTEEFARYEQFLHEELIPWVESRHPVVPGPRGRALMGSSMGGLVSFGLAANRPDVFGAAACLSPWFEYEDYYYIRTILRERLDRPNIRVYMDSGIRDWRGLDDGHRGMLMARVELLRLGFVPGPELDVFVDTETPSLAELESSPVRPDRYGEIGPNQHQEYQWRRRLERPLRFLFGHGVGHR